MQPLIGVQFVVDQFVYVKELRVGISGVDYTKFLARIHLRQGHIVFVGGGELNEKHC